MRIVRSVAAMQRLARRWRRQGVRVALVPTMGCLHAGHTSLVRRARRLTENRGRVVVSIYVNPTQFGMGEDFSKYPRDLQGDLKLCRAADVDVVFAPGDATMYPRRGETADEPAREDARPTAVEFSTYVVEERLSQVMEGAARPTHFRGVTTVVAKLFNIVLPDVAVFGAKDYQQAAIIKRMVADLNFAVKIRVAPTVRERDGLALSSRNRYLSAEERSEATTLYRAIQRARAAVRSKGIPAAQLRADLKKFIASQPHARLDYIGFFDSHTLMPRTTVQRGTHMALAVFFGTTRLIDNARL